MNIILATRNPSKAEQIRAIFAGTDMRVMTLDDARIEGEAIEDGDTLEANALKKSLYTHERIPGEMKKDAWVMADDTGLFIDALDGLPGVKSARWAGDTATTDEITAYTLKKLECKNDRSATFRTVVSLISPEGKHSVFEGQVKGKLLQKPVAKAQLKMPYSPLFQPDGHDKVWSEMTTDEENAISHRGIAFRKARAFLESILSA